MEFHGHVTDVSESIEGSETTADLLAAETLIPVADSGDFEGGTHALIAGTVYAYSAIDDGEDSGQPSITLDSGLATDVDEATRVEVWNPNTSTVISEWLATVTDDNDGSSIQAPLTHTLIAMFDADIRGLVGESVTAYTDEGGEWWVGAPIGKTPGFDPRYFKTGTLSADTQIIAGDEDGKRVVMDGTGTPAFEAYNAANEQTVNIDGEDNFIQGSLATAADGARVETGPGQFGSFATNEIRFYTGAVDELDPGLLASFTALYAGDEFGVLRVSGHEWSGQPSAPRLTLSSSTSSKPSEAAVAAEEITLDGTTNAFMGTGSVGTGTFRDSVDARVTAVGGGAYQPLDSDLTAIAALSTTSYGRAFLALANQAALMALLSAASETTAGKAEIATQAETDTGTDDARIVTPAKLATRLAAVVVAASESAAGIAEIATQTETNTGTDDARIVTPLKLQTRMAAYAQPRIVAGTTSTAVGTTAKTATISGYTPAAGDLLALTVTNGNTALAPTLNINSGGAVSITAASVSPVFDTAAGAIWFLYYTGTTWVLTGNPDPTSNFNSNKLASGQAAYHRDSIWGSAQMVSQRLVVVTFTAEKIFTAANIKTVTGATAAAGATTAKVGFVQVNSDDTLTLLGKSANDTALWGTANTAYTKALDLSTATVRGQRYGIAFLFDGTTPPSLIGQSHVNGSVLNTNVRLVAEYASQTDIPSSLAAMSGTATLRPWAVLLP
jgi:hypothetical protein